MPKPVIFIDLDGTVFRVQERVWRVYRDILEKYNKKFLSKKDYIELKRKKTPLGEILKMTGAKDISSDFEKDWQKMIEKQDYLKLDEIPPANRKALLKLKKDWRLVLVTARQKKQNLFWQLSKKKIDGGFDRVLNGKVKYEMIKKYGNYNKDSVMVGDTETDIKTGKRLGLRTVAVISGQRNGEFLRKYKPNILIDEIS